MYGGALIFGSTYDVCTTDRRSTAIGGVLLSALRSNVLLIGGVLLSALRSNVCTADRRSTYFWDRKP